MTSVSEKNGPKPYTIKYFLQKKSVTILLQILVLAGGINAGQNRIRIESKGNFYSLHDIRSLTIVSRTGEHFRLADITRIEEGYLTPPANTMRINGSPTIGIAVSTVPTGNVVEWQKPLRNG